MIPALYSSSGSEPPPFPNHLNVAVVPIEMQWNHYSVGRESNGVIPSMAGGAPSNKKVSV